MVFKMQKKNEPLYDQSNGYTRNLIHLSGCLVNISVVHSFKVNNVTKRHSYWSRFSLEIINKLILQKKIRRFSSVVVAKSSQFPTSSKPTIQSMACPSLKTMTVGRLLTENLPTRKGISSACTL